MSEPSTPHETQPEPKSTSSEKPSIRVSQEEYIDDMAAPSRDKSEYEPVDTPEQTEAE